MTTDYDASHGFLSTKGSSAARLLTLRVNHNQAHRQKATEILAAIDNADETHFDERSIHRIKVQTETLQAIDFDDWHSYSELCERRPEKKALMIGEDSDDSDDGGGEEESKDDPVL